MLQRHPEKLTRSPRKTDTAANYSRDKNLPLPNITTSQVKERLARDENKKQLYRQLCSTKVLRQQKEMLYVPLRFDNGLTKDALVDSRALVSATAKNESGRMKQQAFCHNLQKR